MIPQDVEGSREEVLRRVLTALDTPAQSGVRSDHIPRAYRRSSHLDGASRIALFAERLSDYGVTVHRTSRTGLAVAVAAAVGPQRPVVVAQGLDLAWLPPGLDQLVDGPAVPVASLDLAAAAVTTCAAAIAETGTLILDGGTGQGRRALTLIPDHHVCIVPVELVFSTVAEAIRQLEPSRPLTFISGPSATSDIELSRVEGVHGPRLLNVVILER